MLTKPIDYLLALLIIFYNIKMLVELFYLLAFMVGLGAVFVFLVVGQKKKGVYPAESQNKISVNNIHNGLKEEKK